MTSNEAVQAGPTIPDTMRAAVLRDHDKGLEIETIRTPRPKAGEVLKGSYNRQEAKKWRDGFDTVSLLFCLKRGSSRHSRKSL